MSRASGEDAPCPPIAAWAPLGARPTLPRSPRPFYGNDSYANSRNGSNEPLRIDALSSKPSHPSIIDA